MAHFAKINEQNIVENVLVVPDIQEHRGEEYLNELGLEGRWIQTSYNNKIRHKFASVFDVYIPELDIFLESKPFESFVLDNETLSWEAPVPYPSGDLEYTWDEESLSWKIVDNSTSPE